MLVLTRKHQEQIRIGDNVTLTILKVKGNTVKVGIEAPREVRVVRGELPPKDVSAVSSTIASSEPRTISFSEAVASEKELPADDNPTESDRLRQLVRERRQSAAVAANAV